ncbi:MAG: histidine kinase [Bacteroidota bacterium]
MQSTRQQYLVFTGSVLLYLLIHEVVYGLLGFTFFWDSFFVELFLTGFTFWVVGSIQQQLRPALEQKYDWSENPVRRLMAQSLSFTLVSGLFITTIRLVFTYAESVFLGNIFVSLQSLIIDFCILVAVIEIRVLLEFGQYLLQKWNSARIEMATFQKEKAQFSLELLRTQINPHFLFNNLNTLSSLIYIDQDKAAAFLRKLSGVYRSILEYRNKEVITLAEELTFFVDYKELLEIRFENMLFFKVSIAEDMQHRNIIPLTLQMLVENAIKHNVLSQNRPLHITIETNGDYLLVENNFQPKEVLEYSSGLGLKMIENRFAYLSKLPVVIDQTTAHFLVKIPLIDSQ